MLDISRPALAETPVAAPARYRFRRGHLLAAALLFLAAVVQRPVASFRYDAQLYWAGSRALFDPTSVYQAGWLHSRGVLTPLVYAPAALADRLIHGAGPAAVLAENALLIAALGMFILPGIAGALGVSHRALVWLCVGLTGLVAARFAPYPLMDLPAAVAFAGVLWLAASRSAWGLALAGLAAGVTLNLRPAYLAPLAVVVVTVALWRRVRALPFVAGGALALLPQVWLNLRHRAGLSVTPPDTAKLVDLQTGYAAYVVRYDTIVSGGPPQQFYCDPAMARALSGHQVGSTGQFLSLLAHQLPESLLFLGKKFAAALAWSPATPYGAPAELERAPSVLPIVAITVVGILALVTLAIRRRRGYAPLVALAAAASCGSLVTSATEARFALPVVFVAVAGCALLLPSAPTADCGQIAWRRPRWIVGAVGVTALVLVFAAWGLADPLPPGPGSASACATLDPSR